VPREALERLVRHPERFRKARGEAQRVAEIPPGVGLRSQVLELDGRALILEGRLDIRRHIALGAQSARVDDRELRMGAPIAERVRQRVALVEQRTGLFELDAHPPAHVQDLRAGGEPECGGLAVARQLAKQGAHPRPVVHRRSHVRRTHPVRRTPVPASGRERLAGLVVVVGQQRGAFFEMVGVVDLGGPSHRGVHGPAPLFELAPERHLLGERVLEGVLDDRIDRGLVQELGAAERRQRALQRLARELRDLGEQRLGEVLPDHGGDLEQALLALGEPVDPGGEHRLHVGGDLEALDRRDEPVGAALAFEVARLDQGLCDLLGEERIAARAGVDRLGERGEARVASQHGGEELADRLRAERRQRDLPVPGLLHPFRVILGPEVQQQQPLAPALRLHHLLQELAARVVDPVEVLDQRHRGPALRDALDDLAHHRQDLTLACLRIEARRRAPRVGDPEEVEQQRQCLGELLVEHDHAACDLLARGPVVVLRCDPEIGAEHFEDGEERDVLPVCDGTAFEDAEAARAAALEELEAEAALAGARLRDDADRLSIPGGALLERVLERADVGGAADETGEPARPGDVEARSRGAEPDEPVHLDRLGHALHPELAEILEVEVAAGERRGGGGQVAGVGRGERLHALREADRMPLRCVVHAQVVADLADDDLARVDPHARREADAVLALHLGRVARDLVSQAERRVACPLRMVLVRDGRPEQRHDAVARVLVDGALEAVHAVGQDREEAIEDPVPLLRVELAGQLHRPLHVGKQHRDLLALAFERRLRLEDPVGEVLRGVGAGVALGRRRGRRLCCRAAERLRALAAELEARRALEAAARAHTARPQRRGAASAELEPFGVREAAGGAIHGRSLSRLARVRSSEPGDARVLP
jgi:hypothetical protein